MPEKAQNMQQMTNRIVITFILEKIDTVVTLS